MDPVFIALCATAAFKYAVLVWGHRRRPVTAKHVGKVTAIWYYPVKSCRGIQLQQATCTPEGLQPRNNHILDRHLLVCNPETGSFLTQRQLPAMSRISPEVINSNTVEFTAPGVTKLTVTLPESVSQTIKCRVWEDQVAGVYCGKEAEQWLSGVLGRPACLVFCHPDLGKRELSNLRVSRWHLLTAPQDKVAYADFAPYLMTTEASLADLNEKLKKPVLMECFRPNIVVDAIAPFQEDDWKEIYIGNNRFRNLKPCTRCVMTTVNSHTGTKDAEMEPLKTLKSYRLDDAVNKSSPLFGVNLFADFSGDIQVGQPVYASKTL